MSLLRGTGVLLMLDGYGTGLPILVGAVDHGHTVLDKLVKRRSWHYLHMYKLRLHLADCESSTGLHR